MSTPPILIRIEECPFCHQTHDYELAIRRVTVMGLSGSTEDKVLKCVFTCSQHQKKFEADVPLKQNDNEEILSVSAEEVLE
jgi:hypothetical protein